MERQRETDSTQIFCVFSKARQLDLIVINNKIKIVGVDWRIYFMFVCLLGIFFICIRCVMLYGRAVSFSFIWKQVCVRNPDIDAWRFITIWFVL